MKWRMTLPPLALCLLGLIVFSLLVGQAEAGATVGPGLFPEGFLAAGVESAPAEVPLAPDVSIALSGTVVVLNWGLQVRPVDHYEVWRSANNFYFAPGADCASPAPDDCFIRLGLTYTDSAAIGDLANNYTYAVIAANVAGKSDPSNWVGEFGFALQPGSAPLE